jgi:CheY-like chemotaxis protein
VARPFTILFIEDNDVVLRVVKKTLELEGWRVEICEDGGAALRGLEGEGRYDLIIADDDLPGASGLGLIRRAHAPAPAGDADHHVLLVPQQGGGPRRRRRRVSAEAGGHLRGARDGRAPARRAGAARLGGRRSALLPRGDGRGHLTPHSSWRSAASRASQRRRRSARPRRRWPRARTPVHSGSIVAHRRRSRPVPKCCFNSTPVRLRLSPVADNPLCRLPVSR